MKDTFSTLFYLKGKTKQDEIAPIYVRVTVRGQRAEISLKRSVLKEKWNSVKGRLNGSSDNVKTLNHYLNTVEYKIQQAHYHLIQNDLPITSLAIKNKYLGISEERKGLLEVFHYHNSQLEELIGVEYSKSTVTKYKTTCMHLTSFITSYFRTHEILLVDLKKRFISDFAHYLMTEKKIGVNTSNKYLMHLKKVLKFSALHEWIVVSPFEHYKLKNKPVIKGFLSSDELDAIVNTDIPNLNVDLVRDVFVFCCLTGLSYIDIKNLSTDNVVIGVDRNTWVHIHRQKTLTSSRIPLSEHAKMLIKKYQNQLNTKGGRLVFPVHSNQKMNVYLKLVADFCGIEKNLTMHVARHTFATRALTSDVPMVTVSNVLGHKSIKTTQGYAKLVDSKISSDMTSFIEGAPSLADKCG